MKLKGLLVIAWGCMLARTVVMFRAHAHFSAAWAGATCAASVISVVVCSWELREFLKTLHQYRDLRRRTR